MMAVRMTCWICEGSLTRWAEPPVGAAIRSGADASAF